MQQIYCELCNKNQTGSLFILILFRQSTSTRFWHICSSSSGGIMYLRNNWYVLCYLADCLLAGPADIHSTKKPNTYQLLYIYSILPDDGLQICPKRVEVNWRNKLRINSTSSLFLLHRCIERHGQYNVSKISTVNCCLCCRKYYINCTEHNTCIDLLSATVFEYLFVLYLFLFCTMNQQMHN